MMIRNETFNNGTCIEAGIYDLATGTYTREEMGVVVEGPRPMTEAEWLTVDPPPAPGDLDVDRWTIPADGTSYAVLNFGCGDAASAHFVVDGSVVEVPAVRQRATLELAISAPGAIDVRVQDKQATIIGVAP